MLEISNALKPVEKKEVSIETSKVTQPQNATRNCWRTSWMSQSRSWLEYACISSDGTGPKSPWVMHKFEISSFVSGYLSLFDQMNARKSDIQSGSVCFLQQEQWGCYSICIISCLKRLGLPLGFGLTTRIEKSPETGPTQQNRKDPQAFRPSQTTRFFRAFRSRFGAFTHFSRYI